jgi:hypothetical protein
VFTSAGIRCNASRTLQFDEFDLMRSRPVPERSEGDLLRQKLANIINMRHEPTRAAQQNVVAVRLQRFAEQRPPKLT